MAGVGKVQSLQLPNQSGDTTIATIITDGGASRQDGCLSCLKQCCKCCMWLFLPVCSILLIAAGVALCILVGCYALPILLIATGVLFFIAFLDITCLERRTQPWRTDFVDKKGPPIPPATKERGLPGGNSLEESDTVIGRIVAEGLQARAL